MHIQFDASHRIHRNLVDVSNLKLMLCVMLCYSLKKSKDYETQIAPLLIKNSSTELHLHSVRLV